MYKYAVFDLDETIGCFMELGILWDSLSSILAVSYTHLRAHET